MSSKIPIIGVSGPSGSGKTTFARFIENNCKIALLKVLVIAFDLFYKTVPKETLEDEKKIAEYNFDEPESLDYENAKKTLTILRNGGKVNLPRYNYEKHQSEKGEEVCGVDYDIIILEGILWFVDAELVNMTSLVVLVDASQEDCLNRRILRDIRERGRTREGVIAQYNKFVRPSHEKYGAPFRELALSGVFGTRLIVVENKHKNGENISYFDSRDNKALYTILTRIETIVGRTILPVDLVRDDKN